jgi:L-aspartate oxidase
MQLQTDILIIGTGIAGLSLALEISKNRKVTVVTKGRMDESNSKYAQGGISAVLSPDDSVESHVFDTITAGAELCNIDAVKLLAENGAKAIEKLVNIGTKFTKNVDSNAWNQLDLGREGGHRACRVVHSQDQTGLVIENALITAVKKEKNISILENYTLAELITNHSLETQNESSKACYGAYVFDRKKGKMVTLLAQKTVLATGGIGEVYQHTTNPTIATGDGVAAAWRAGANVSNMEFVQFHPTTLFHPKADSFLISEAVRGFGAVLKDSNGVEFMKKYHKMGSLAPRDIVARSIDTEMKKSGEESVYLDVRDANPDDVRERFPKIYANCLRFGIDITRDLIPVVPASHYSCGGVTVNAKGESSISNLFALGESACTGVHGANRLASNSLLEAVVFAEVMGVELNKETKVENHSFNKIKEWDSTDTSFAEEWVLISHTKKEIQRIMWDYVGIIRNNERLNRALKRIHLIKEETELFYRKTKICTPILELRNMATVAEIIIHSALSRKESRGLHYTSDYPKADSKLKKNTVISIDKI